MVGAIGNWILELYFCLWQLGILVVEGIIDVGALVTVYTESILGVTYILMRASFEWYWWNNLDLGSLKYKSIVLTTIH